MAPYKEAKHLLFHLSSPTWITTNLINVSSVYSFSKTYFVIHLESLLSFSFRYPRDTLMWRDRFTWHAHVTWHAMWRDTPTWRGTLCDVSRSHGVTRSRVTHQVRLERQKKTILCTNLQWCSLRGHVHISVWFAVFLEAFGWRSDFFPGVVSFLALRQSRPKLVNRIASKSRHFFVSY